MPNYNVASFNLDHTKVLAPYVRTAGVKTGPKGDIVSKFDIRFCQPNFEFMTTGTIHSLEHLLAEYIRDEFPGEKSVIDLSPMGCRTGFYFTLFGEWTEKEIADKFLIVLKKIIEWPDDKKIPGTDPKECGNYKDHDLKGAKIWAEKWVSGIEKKGPAWQK